MMVLVFVSRQAVDAEDEGIDFFTRPWAGGGRGRRLPNIGDNVVQARELVSGNERSEAGDVEDPVLHGEHALKTVSGRDEVGVMRRC